MSGPGPSNMAAFGIERRRVSAANLQVSKLPFRDQPGETMRDP